MPQRNASHGRAHDEQVPAPSPSTAPIDVSAKRPRTANAGPFHKFANRTSQLSGNASTFVVASLAIVAWAVTGPIFGFSDTWQLVINTSTTIVTFLMVFLIQNTQNRDSAAVQLKLDELIRATVGAHNGLLDLEELGDLELATMRRLYRELASRARAGLRDGAEDTGTDEL